MRLLLDTHVFIWWASAPEKLSAKALTACQDRDNSLVLSVASIGEMQIKLQLGKLELTSSLKELVERQQQMNDLQLLPVQLPHVLALSDLPPHHKDPFDRLIVAQANVENLILISADRRIADYAVQLVW
jgi:PIN domain nuclease of toxin-antitoxin system